MDDRNYKLEALVLSSFPYGEADRIVSVFSRERGRQSILARGALKPKNSLRGLCQPPRYCRLEVAKSRGSLDILTQGELLEPYLTIHNDLVNIAYCSYISELLIAGMPEQKPQEDVFLLALAAFTLLELGENPPLALIVFQLRYLKYLGLFPRLDKCDLCGCRLERRRFYLSPLRGALVCTSCYGSEEGLMSAGAVKTMELLTNLELHRLASLKVSPVYYDEIGAALENYLDYHLEYNAKARGFLNDLLAEEK